MISIWRPVFGLVFFGAVSISSPAYAYLDPGTGSMLLQMLLGGVAGALVVGKLYWHRIQEFFGRGAPKNENQEHPTDPDAK